MDAGNPYREALDLFDTGDPYVVPRAVALGRDALRGYLKSVLGEREGNGDSLIELAVALEERKPAFQASRELPAVEGKRFTIMEALELFAQLQPQTDGKTLRVLLGFLVGEILKLRARRRAKS